MKVRLLHHKKHGWIAELHASFHIARPTPKGWEFFIKGVGHLNVTPKQITEIREAQFPKPIPLQELKALIKQYGRIVGEQLAVSCNHVSEMMVHGYVTALLNYDVDPEFESAFQETFKLPVFVFYDPLCAMFGMWSFDIIRFDKYLKKNFGYKEDEHGSIHDFLLQTCGSSFAQTFGDQLLPNSKNAEKTAAL